MTPHQFGNLGLVDWRQGRFQQAATHYRQAPALHRQTGHRPGEADALAGLGDVFGRQGRYPQVARHYQQALALSRETGHQTGEADALNGLGEALLAVSQTDQACPQHAAALALASQIGDTYQQARAHHGLGACHAVGNPGQARRHWQQALIFYTSLGAPEADQVRASLHRLGQS
jgi:tetratricopeptide (TPR) repeat protein